MEATGVYTKTVFRNETDGFTIFKFKLNKPLLGIPSLEITCKGTIRSSLICVPLKLSGEITTDDYGETFNIKEAEPFSDSEAITIEYLSSNLFDGIAETTAKRIVEVTGPDIFSFIHTPNAKEELSSIKGLTDEKISNLFSTLLYSKTQKEIFEFISAFGGNFRHAEAIFEEYGQKSISILKENPYKATDINIPFRICDCIAKQNGIQYDNIERVKALILNVIHQCYTHGDMYVLIDRVFRGVDYTVKNLSVFPDKPISYGLIITALNDMKHVITEITEVKNDTDNDTDENTEVRYYLKRAFFDEKTVADNVSRLHKCARDFNICIESSVKDIEKRLNIKYSNKQKECFRFLSKSGLKIVTGGPGTGKSTVINGLIQAFINFYPDAEVKIMAPTGRAAQRVSEISGLPAGTIHRMLNILPYASDMLDSAYNGDYGADLLIVDEASMLDTTLAGLLLKSVKSDTLVIFCGDIDQLPSVGAGNVFNELISSGFVDTVQLDTNYRQAGKATIITNALKINAGDPTLIADSLFEIIECVNEDEIQKTAVDIFVDNYNTRHPYDVQVISSTKKGPAGTVAINKQIQSIVNTGKAIGAHNNGKFKINDKVMTVHNNYELGYFNGDIGIITSSDERSLTVQFLKDEITIPKNLIQDVELAYACTVHKSQGSEYDTVIIALPATPSVMLKRNLLYTAITRAKKRVIIITQKGCINHSVITCADKKRISALSEKIMKNIGGH